MAGNLKVFCIGETVLDIIFRDDIPVAAKPGGSMLNSAVSLGRAGISPYFISDFGTDHAGDVIQAFLEENGIHTSYVSRYSDGKTALALAFLDERQNASYSFYKIFPAERLPGTMPLANAGDIVLFGSFYAITMSLRPKIMAFVRQAKAAGAFILYDPNFRSAHLDELETLKPWIIENMSLANLVRGSDEDFMNIFSAGNADHAFEQVGKAGCPALVYTENKVSVEVRAPGFSRSYPVPPIRPVSTIGAGDAFNAGLIHALSSLPGPGVISSDDWDRLISRAIRFSADVCQGMDNYISVELGNQFK